MAGLVFGNVAGALESFFFKIIHYIVEGLRWIKQALIKVMHAIEKGITNAVNYEKTVVREAIRGISRHDDLMMGIAFALIFDFLGVNG